jgi:hypothetical protein
MALSDPAGYRWGTPEETADLPAGASALGVVIPTAGLPAGLKVVEIDLRDADSDQLIASVAHDLTLDGLSLLAWLDAGLYDAEESSAELTARLWDEDGEPVSGAAAGCTAELDGSALSVIFAEPAAGAYTTTFSLVDLGLGAHRLELRCEDARGLAATAALGFAYGEPSRVYLPVVLRNG